MHHNHDVLDEMRQPVAQLRQAIPGVFKAYADMHHAVITDSVLPAKFKEIIAIAIAVSEGCDGCIASHARGAVRHGATVEEVAEAIGVCILMGGGPATVYGPRALEAFLEFAATPAK